MILITGATGNIGKELIPILSRIAQSIRVLVRDEKKVAHLDASIERTVGDLNDPKTLIPAMCDVDRIFLVTFETQQDINAIEKVVFVMKDGAVFKNDLAPKTDKGTH